MGTAPKHIVIVGAGPGGSAAAMLLASRGFKVSVFEKDAQIGGRSASRQQGDYRFDLGPTFLMMKFLLDELFETVGRATGELLDCRRLDPMYELKFGDRSLKMTGDRAEMSRRIDALFPGEGAGYNRFLARESTRFHHMYPCLQREFSGLRDLLNPTVLRAAPYLSLGRSLHSVLSDYFRSPELQMSFCFQAKYLGMSPWECPGLFAMIPYVEHAHGIYHVMGGLSEIPKAFARVAREYGAEFHVGTPVRRVLRQGRRAVGVELEDGAKIAADEVILNADFAHAMANLFEPGDLKKYTRQRVEKMRYSCSTFMMYLGLNRLYPSQFHTILFAKDYRRNVREVAQGKSVSEDFSVYVRNASILDPSLAPPGHSALYVLVPVPNNFSDVDWESEAPRLRERTLDLLEARMGMEGLRKHIVTEQLLTPIDWELKHAVYRGATFNLSHGLSQMLHFRPRNRFEELSHCYLVGGGTSPGSGLPTIFESARIATRLICDKYAMPFPTPRQFISDSAHAGAGQLMTGGVA